MSVEDWEKHEYPPCSSSDTHMTYRVNKPDWIEIRCKLCWYFDVDQRPGSLVYLRGVSRTRGRLMKHRTGCRAKSIIAHFVQDTGSRTQRGKRVFNNFSECIGCGTRLQGTLRAEYWAERWTA